MTLSTKILATRESFSKASVRELQRIVRNVREVLDGYERAGSVAWSYGISAVAIARRELKVRKAYNAWLNAQRDYFEIAEAHDWVDISGVENVAAVCIRNYSDYDADRPVKYYDEYRTYRSYEACVIGEGLILQAAAEVI